jgi:hypothetical protein
LLLRVEGRIRLEQLRKPVAGQWRGNVEDAPLGLERLDDPGRRHLSERLGGEPDGQGVAGGRRDDRIEELVRQVDAWLDEEPPETPGHLLGGERPEVDRLPAQR